MSIRSLVVAATVLSLSSVAADWTQFRGPNGSGVAESPALPVEFGKGKNQVWRTELPPGYSSPVLGAKCLYLTAHQAKKGLLYCVDPATGEVRWQKQVFELTTELPRVNTPVSPTPVTDGRNVYAFFEAVGLIAYNDQGTELWRVPLGKFNNPYGMAASPILIDKTLLLQADQDTGSFLLAVATRDGKVLWKTPRPEFQHGFSTPILYRPKGQPAQVILSGSYQVAGYSVETGEKLWWVNGMAWQAKSLPVVEGSQLYVHSWMAELSEIVKMPKDKTWDQYLAEYDANKDGAISQDEGHDKEMPKLWFLFDLDRSGKIEAKDWELIQARNTARSGLFAIQLGGQGDLTKTAVEWRAEKSLPNIPSPLLYKGVLYVLKEGGILTSYQPKTGEVLKQARIEGAVDAYFASPIAADGKIITAARNGKVAVIRAGPQWELLQVNDLEEETWATPAIEGGRLFVRTQKALYCFALPSKAVRQG